MARMHRATVLAAALILAASPALAQLNVGELAAGVAIPFDARLGFTTEIAITNGASSERTLHFDLINGDPGENWVSQSWICTLTARETMRMFVIGAGVPNGSLVTFECDAVEGAALALFPPFANTVPPHAGSDGLIESTAQTGVIWVSVQNASGQTVPDNVLFADFTIIHAATAAAVSAPAAHFQGTQNDGNRVYVFDGIEYSAFPAALATNYLPPADYPGRLLVYTLDGTTGTPPQVRARVLWYNDDEDYEDTEFEFECMDLIDYSEIGLGLGALGTAGHMEIIPVVHTGQFPGDFDDTHSPLLCYNIQDAPDGGSTMRPCAQSTAAFRGLRSSGGGNNIYAAPRLDTQL